MSYGYSDTQIKAFAFLFSLLFLAAAVARGQSFKFEKLLTKATADSVQIECGISSGDAAAELDLDGVITHTGAQRPLWRGPLGQLTVQSGKTNLLRKTLSLLKPDLWSPSAPNLYTLTVVAKNNGTVVADKTIRLGFRTFESRDGQFYLNGRPVFLRGLAINPPGRTIPADTGESRAFAEAYVGFLKNRNLNTIRMTHDSQVWFDVCDELGMMVYQGQYGSPLESDAGKKSPPRDFNASIAAYKQLFETYASHPSILIYVLSNELPVSGSRGKAFHDYLARACAELKAWDPTRLYIGNAGYGEGREGDVCDVHRYWGWYDNTFLTFYNLREPNIFTDGAGSILKSRSQRGEDEDAAPAGTDDASRPKLQTPNSKLQRNSKSQASKSESGFRRADTSAKQKEAFTTLPSNQPLTFTECVGNFTGPLGEYNLILRKQLGAQLNWTGHSAHQREDALEYQSFAIGQIAETFRRLRPLNPRVSGLMPFTILFYNWSGITNFEQMKPKPAVDALARAYQPILLSWENWSPQIYSGTIIRPVAHVINDAEDGKPLANSVLECRLIANAGREVQRWKPVKLPAIPYYAAWSSRLELQPPAGLPDGDYHLLGTVLSNGKIISQNQFPLFVAPKASPGAHGSVRSPAPSLYDPPGRTAAALKKLQIPFRPVQRLSQAAISDASALIIGEDAWDASATSAASPLRNYVQSGGRVLVMKQDPGSFDTSWLPQAIAFFCASANDPTYPPAARPFSGNMNINPERPDHPVFHGLDRKRLAVWSDYTNWEQTRPGFPQIYPVTAGFKLVKAESLERVAILADYDRGLEGIALCEMFDGRGSVLVSAFDLAARAGLDPAADRLLANLAAYLTAPQGHETHPLIESPIEWGNYASERGLVAGPIYGLAVNAAWVRPITNPSARALKPQQGAWNTRPGDQFVPHGRSPLGPYGYSTGSSLRDFNPGSETGSGLFWARIPAGKSKVTTLVENPSSTPAALSVIVNDVVGAKTVAIAAGEKKLVEASIPSGETDLCVRYAGTKSLIILTTTFE